MPAEKEMTDHELATKVRDLAETPHNYEAFERLMFLVKETDATVEEVRKLSVRNTELENENETLRANPVRTVSADPNDKPIEDVGSL